MSEPTHVVHVPGTLPIRTGPRHPRCLGLGVVGLHEGRTLLAAMDRCSMIRAVAGCDLDPEKVEGCRRRWPGLFYTAQYEEMLARPDVDVVAIYTPDSLHAGQIVTAFETGKHVICTKPLVNAVEGARAVLESGRRAGRRLQVGQSTRFFEPFLRQRAAFERGEFGTLELADAHYLHRMDWYYAKSPWAAQDTDWAFLGLSHPIDLLRWYLGPIATVHASGTTSALARRFGVLGFDVYTVNVMAASGALGRAMGHYGIHELPSARNCIELMLYGSGGTSLAQYHDMRYVHTAPGPQEREASTEVTEDHLYAGRQFYFNNEVHGMHYGEFANYAEAFARSILEGTPAGPGLEEGIETFCIMEAARRSASEGGRVIKVREVLAEVGH